ncbi:hypothetical protein E3T43_00955 [Cryobacterium sp. Hh7]|uniref:hypothetical protein n=1 Tax=Cryobacterium sp. Hh7 TaxID=1259159 RepID=UPI00106AFD8C|nr:hypothetical protein [Cryobacterium sp. Hh7]TFD61195.1 hypothetical protein E3T43_00955 [Cryobacterium sp. Hh7]
MTALKAAETERKALESLSDRYGIDSMETIELLQESKRLYRGIAGFIETHPEHASLLISEVEKTSPDFAVILRQVQFKNNITIEG